MRQLLFFFSLNQQLIFHLCKSCWQNPDNTAEHSSRTGILQTAGPSLDLCKTCSQQLIHSSGTGCCKLWKDKENNCNYWCTSQLHK